ncbi:hypothetical protein [Edaphobacter bradus]|uniref:hypothetical protein n=1 Tax=Edaphobacter bradus TaxID=2259016 RepID=UPI0021E0466F|nr:hypothetical protein [Edaphobacter bradus]
MQGTPRQYRRPDSSPRRQRPQHTHIPRLVPCDPAILAVEQLRDRITPTSSSPDSAPSPPTTSG